MSKHSAEDDYMFKFLGHFMNKWDVLMWAGVATAITSDLVVWVGSNITIFVGIAAALFGGFKSWQQGRLIREQRRTERLEQEKLKEEIKQLKVIHRRDVARLKEPENE